MKISFSLPYRTPDGMALRLEELQDIARYIEAAGFDSVWVSDTVARGRDARPDPLMYLLIAASATKHLELGTSVMQVPVRNTVDLAQRLLCMHTLTNGRFVFGAGAGSSKADFDSTGTDFDQRFANLKEALATIKKLCRGETVGAANLTPWPNAVPGPPILIGAWTSGIWVKRAAREYDGWLSSGGGPGGTNFGNLRDGIKLFRDEGGKRAIVASVGVGLQDEPAGPITDESRFTLRCAPDEALPRLKLVEELGYDDVLLRKDDLTYADVDALAAALQLKRRDS